MVRALRAACAVLALLAAGGAGAQEPCRQALALGLDVSGSVDPREYELQIEGLARALETPEVLEAVLAMPGAPVRLYVYEWAGEGWRRELMGWRALRSGADLSAAAQALRDVPRVPRDPGTAMGQAIIFGGAALARQKDCWARTLDISADGKSNVGIRPRELRANPLLQGVTLNGLAVGSGRGELNARQQAGLEELARYFEAEVILGEGAFVEVATTYEDYTQAMTRKLLKELQVVVIGLAE